MNPAVDEYIESQDKWNEALTFIRSLLLDIGLTEELKWRSPCYTYNGKIILLLQGFKHYCTISYFKGSLLADPDNLFVKVPESTQYLRKFQFTNLEQVHDVAEKIVEYTYEAIEIEKAGLEVPKKHISTYEVPEELQRAFDKQPALKASFDTLTPGRQRGYLLHIAQAKQAKTRESRVENCIDRILAGKGRGECFCGLSKKLPHCDGSHKCLK